LYTFFSPANFFVGFSLFFGFDNLSLRIEKLSIMAKTKEIKVADLQFDNKNFNKHTEFGMSLIEKSLRKNGAGRSILIDKNNRIIGGNGVVENAGQIGMEDVIVVETDGTKLVAVKRTDIDLDSKQGREMALADNATAAADLSWNTDELQKAIDDFEIDTDKWGVRLHDDGTAFFNGERNGEANDEYDEFTDKFKPKLTTDDCYTPAEVYDEVAKYVRGIVGEEPEFVRPFFPGGDYQSFKYPKGCVVVDNPPFSIYAEIVRWYLANNIKFFLFAPALTQVVANAPVSYVVAFCDVTYENGAVVRTSFTTNLLGDIVFTTAPQLKRDIEKANGKDGVELPVYGYENVITTALLGKISLIDFSAKRGEVAEVSNLDALKARGKSLYGRGWLLSERKEKERKEKERKENRLDLSERELKIIEGLL
jgi:hypothetical protein